jgi:hypothetical protein
MTKVIIGFKNAHKNVQLFSNVKNFTEFNKLYFPGVGGLLLTSLILSLPAREVLSQLQLSANL